MKKVLSLALSILMIFALCSVAFAADYSTDKKLAFHEDGTFKILQINDTQDIDKMNKKTVEFLKAGIAQEQPDLIVVPGDMLSDMFIGATPKRIKAALTALGTIFNDAKVPFAVTFGNHDHDLEDKVSTKDMMEVFKQFEYCVTEAGTTEGDPGSYAVPVYSSKDGSKMALNVYMIDTNNKNGTVTGYSGVYPEQVEWYKQKSDELKAANGGEVVPSLLFQHVPVKEIYQFVDQVTYKEANNACLNIDDRKWYSLNENSGLIGDDNNMGEAPCSEPLDHTTGQYEAWLEKGDIIGAFFAHDHVNNFMGKTAEGIILGYNGGTGFRAYGRGDHRSMRVFNINENDVENYETHSIYYSDVVGEKFDRYFSDFMTPAIFGDIIRVFLKMFFIIPA